MKVVTWNLFGLESRNLDARTEAAVFQMLLGHPDPAKIPDPPPALPDVLMLQEVVERTYFAHLRPHLTAAGFELFPDTPPARNYFEVIATRGMTVEQSSTRPFERSGQGRHLNQVHVRTDDGPLALATAHLESLKSGTEFRTEQASAVLDWLDAHPAAIFGGDTNLRDTEANALAFPDGVTDAFEAARRPKGAKATYKFQRYDRFWTRGMSVSGFRTFGGASLPGLGEPPSDHRGLQMIVAAAGAKF